MTMKLILSLLAAMVAMASAKVYFAEKFDDGEEERAILPRRPRQHGRPAAPRRCHRHATAPD